MQLPEGRCMNSGSLAHEAGSVDCCCQAEMRRQPSRPSSDASENTKARTLLGYQTLSRLGSSSTVSRSSPCVIMHYPRLDFNEKLKWDITRAKGALGTASTSSPMEVDAIRRKKVGAKAKTTARRRRTLRTLTRPIQPRRNAFLAIGDPATRSRKCRMPAADKPPRKRSHNINELSATDSGSSSFIDTADPSGDGVKTGSRRAGEDLDADAANHSHPRLLMLLDSGAVVFDCSPCFVENNVTSLGFKLRSATGAEVEHFGTTSVWKQLGNQAHDIILEGGSGQRPNRLSLSLSRGCVLDLQSARAGWRMLRGQEEIEVLRRDGVCWIRVDDVGDAETPLRLCPLSADFDDELARQARSKKLPVVPDEGTRSMHRMTHLPPRSWCDHCVQGFSLEDHHRCRDGSNMSVPEVQLDGHVLGDDCRPEQHGGQPNGDHLAFCCHRDAHAYGSCLTGGHGGARDSNRRELSRRARVPESLAGKRQ